MSKKCRLIPREDLPHLEIVCFDIQTNYLGRYFNFLIRFMLKCPRGKFAPPLCTNGAKCIVTFYPFLSLIGPCTSNELNDLRNCTREDVLGDLLNISQHDNSTMDDPKKFLDIIIKTYFSRTQEQKLKEKISYNIKEKKRSQVGEQDLFVGSSSWPGIRQSRVGVFNVPVEPCKCLSSDELLKMTGVYIDHELCTQPVPWCYVKKDAHCIDRVVYNKFGSKVNKGKDSSDNSSSDTHDISWSVEACKYEKGIPQILTKPYFFK